jgi:hypothetical protein
MINKNPFYLILRKAGAELCQAQSKLGWKLNISFQAELELN